MITREMIQNGFNNGSVSIEDYFAGCTSLCCRIADTAFYFVDPTEADLTAKEYLESHTTDEIVDALYAVLNNVGSAELYGLDVGEWEFYKAVLDNEQYEANR